jgi:hypothetical protein
VIPAGVVVDEILYLDWPHHLVELVAEHSRQLSENALALQIGYQEKQQAGQLDHLSVSPAHKVSKLLKAGALVFPDRLVPSANRGATVSTQSSIAT